LFTFVITNLIHMKERLLEFLKAENKTSAQLAEEIGVQASGISHILSGRNNPSLDFVLKMLEKYQYLSTDWLLFGKGSMYTDSKMKTLFDFSRPDNSENSDVMAKNAGIRHETVSQDDLKRKAGLLAVDIGDKLTAEVVKIVWFFNDNSFEEFMPRK
jgi:transcriptional regulator with XRE-family HTH domain